MRQKDEAFKLFAQGKRPSSPELKALGLAQKSLCNYFELWKKSAQAPKAQTADAEAPPATTSTVVVAVYPYRLIKILNAVAATIGTCPFPIA